MTGTEPVDSPECDDGYGSADYEYDLAHELALPSQQRASTREPFVSVELGTEESAGDYGYDLAHDGR